MNSYRLSRIAKKVMGFSGVLFWIGMNVLGHSARIESPWGFYLQLGTLLFPYLFLAGFCFLMFSALTNQWRFLLAQGLLLILCLHPIRQTFALNFPGNKLPENSLRVLSYNVLGFNLEGGRPDSLLAFIRKENPDIICFQEFTDRPSRYGFTLEEIQQKLPAYPYVDFQPHHTTRFQSRIGTCVFSKYPIVHTEPIEYTSRVNSSCQYLLQVRGKNLLLINNHLESNGLSSMDIHLIKEYLYSLDSNLFPIFKDILHGKLAKASQARQQEARLIRDILNHSDTPYQLVCGDLNDTPLSPTLSLLTSNLKDAFIGAGLGLGGTHSLF